MTRKEKEERLEKVERILFSINMIDRWTWRDEEDYEKYTREKEELMRKLQEG